MGAEAFLYAIVKISCDLVTNKNMSGWIKEVKFAGLPLGGAVSV